MRRVSALMISAVVTAPACTGEGTCLEVELEYAGDVEGRVFVRSESPGNGSGLMQFGSVDDALASLEPSALSGSVSCAVRDAPIDEEWTVTAWVDVDGDERCDFAGADYDAECVPDQHDPAASGTIVIPHQTTRVLRLEIEDP